MLGILEDKRTSIAKLFARYRIARLDAFGSALRDDFRPGESDIDLLVEFGPMDPCQRADAYFEFRDDLRRLLGLEVDLVVAEALKNRSIAAEIARTKQVLYAA